MAKRSYSKKKPAKTLKIRLTRAQELNSLYRLAEIAQADSAEGNGLQRMAEEISIVSDFPMIAIELYVESTQKMTLAATHGIDPSDKPLDPGETLAERVLKSEQPLHEKDPVEGFWKERNARSVSAFPLVIGKKCIGVLSLGHPETVETDDPWRRWIEGAAAWVAFTCALNRQIEKKGTQVSDAVEPSSKRVFAQDELTQLPNPEVFKFLLGQSLARSRRSKAMVAVLFLDLDRFMTFRETHGDVIADNIINQVGVRLRRNVREGDAVARWAEDQFIWLISSLQNLDSVAMVAEKMLAVVSRPLEVEDKTHQLTVSIGISLYPFDGAETENLIKHSVAAMRRSKELGRNQYCFYSDEVNSKVAEQLALKRQLKDSLERKEFILHFQPIVSVATGKLESVEAFLRWRSPEGRLLFPDEFIFLSEDTGLIAPLDLWVLKTACAQIKRWDSKGVRVPRLSINLSKRFFKQPDFLDRMIAILKEANVKPDRLELELTERSIMENSQQSAQVLSQLNELGLHIAIDDFGTGDFLLSFLRRLPIGTIKIDPVFLRNANTNQESASMVSGIISLAHALGLRVVAEGVEKESELSFLRQQNCDAYQGHLFSPPVAADALESVVRKIEPKAAHGKPKQDDSLPWPVTAAIAEPAPTPEPIMVMQPRVLQPTPLKSTLLVPPHLDRLPDANTYAVACYNCRGRFDAIATAWCSCFASERTLICPSCMNCFCRASLEYKIDFWADAPRQMWDRRISEEAENESLKPNPTTEFAKHPLILIVDDEIQILKKASKSLEGLGLGVIVATNGEEGLKMAKLYNPEVILSDALMPKMDGREMCRQLKSDPNYKKTRVVIMSSLYTSGKHKSGAFRDFRIDEFLQKPVDFNVLRTLLEKYLS